MKIIYGAVRPDEGEIRWEGEAVEIGSPAAARKLGIGMVFQHFSLFETLTVGENIALALDDKFDLKTLSKRIREVSADYGLDVDPQRHVHSLTVGERQRVEIVRVPAAESAPADHGRADFGADAAGGQEALHGAAAAGIGRLQHSLYQPQARRNPGALRKRDGDARRPRDRQRRSEEGNARVARATDGRPFAAGLHAARPYARRCAARREAPVGGEPGPVRHVARRCLVRGQGRRNFRDRGRVGQRSGRVAGFALRRNPRPARRRRCRHDLRQARRAPERGRAPQARLRLRAGRTARTRRSAGDVARR